jgi:hypothetical protein
MVVEITSAVKNYFSIHRNITPYRLLAGPSPSITLLAQYQSSTPILAHDVERILPDVDADHGGCGIGDLTWRSLFCCPKPASITGGAGARPDHPVPGHRLSSTA